MASPVIDWIGASAYTVPTDKPESDGTIAWDATTAVVVEVHAAGERGIGYAYGDRSAVHLVGRVLAEHVLGASVFSRESVWEAMNRAVRNVGKPGVASTAISAVDVALWDLDARLLGVPLTHLLGGAGQSVPAYGSGGFTSYSDDELAEQLGGWADMGLGMVKMKVGRQPHRDVERVRVARDAIGPNVELFVDANGGYGVKQAVRFADAFARYDVRWFEEPVSSDDLEGLHLVRQRAPAEMDIAAGEYGWDVLYFRKMLQAGAVDVLQADATRCGGITGFLRVAALCEGFNLRLSAHTSPTLHTHVCSGLGVVEHIEYFHDHARLEPMIFDGAIRPVRGRLAADPLRPGLGLFVRKDAERFRTAHGEAGMGKHVRRAAHA